jgi:NAD(P)-dependent dehydrogenase (short-subunit alcohol dehydrogenase family)
MASLTKKTALVTGASRGIGRATASAFAASGAHVLVHYGRSAQDAKSLVASALDHWCEHPGRRRIKTLIHGVINTPTPQ